MENENIGIEAQGIKDKPYIKLLSPKDDLPKDDEYIEFLKGALFTKDICNIALSGEYGSGKSSIIRSFLKINESEKTKDRLKCISISLASFKNEAVDKRILEKSILKQLFYKVDHRSIPNSRYSRIIDIKWWQVLVGMVGIGVISIPFIIWQQRSSLKGLSILGVRGYVLPLMFSGVLATLSLTTIITKTINKFKFKSIKNSKIIDFEMEKKQSENAFDVNIDEIIYLFQKNKYDVVFFEDIDRFEDSIKIFTSLRELNEILNDSDSLSKYKKGKKLKFVYAIKDDVFFEEKKKNVEEKDADKNNSENKNINYKYGLENSKVRTKFFDYIIPVMPVMDANNSYEDITSVFEIYNSKNEKKIRISEGLQSDISIYVDDMRLLRNTFNEFLIYHRKHGNSLKMQEGGVSDSLFSIILYKNMYPQDFAKIYINDGDLYNVFKNKQRLVSNLIPKLDKEIEVINKRIEAIDKAWLVDEKEVLCIYKKFRSGSYINLNDSSCKYIDNLEVEDLKNIRSDDRKIDGIGDILDKINTIEDIEKRENILLKKEKLIKQKQNLLNLTIVELMDKDVNICDEYIKDKEVLKVLLRRGYIAEDYKTYISILKPGRITYNDNEFLKLVTSKTEALEKTKNYLLDNPGHVLMRINENDLGEMGALNLDLLHCIKTLCGEEKYEKRIKRYMDQFKKINEYRAEVISDYLEKYDEGFKQLVQFILEINNDLFEQFKSIEDVKKNTIDIMFYKIISISDINTIKGDLDIYKEYILSNNKFIYLDVAKVFPKKIQDLILKLNINFKNLIFEKDNDNSELIQFIYDHNMYEINEKMIKFIQESIGEIDIDEDSTIYGNIINGKLEKLIDYINEEENINKYLEEVYLNTEYTLKDNKGVIELLNNKFVDLENKSRIIIEKDFAIRDLSIINDKNLYKEILENEKSIVNWSNLELCYNEGGLLEKIIEYLNDVDIAKGLANEEIKNLNFQRDILNNEGIKDENIRYLAKSFGEPFIREVFEKDISDERIRLLIDINMLGLSYETYSYVKKNSKNKVNLIVKYIDLFISSNNTYEINLDEFYSILEKIQKDKQLLVLKQYDFNFLNIEENYKLVDRIIEGTEKSEFIQIKSLIKKAKIKEVLSEKKKSTQRQIIKELSKISNQYKLKPKGKSFVISSKDELCEFEEKLTELNFRITYEENGDVVISLNSTKRKVKD